jgi:KDO2-lipid IV(A) lauroyltransferase
MPSPVLTRIAAGLRFDGLWWRKFAYLGCVYGPDWWKRSSPPAIAATIFLLIGNNRRGAIANLERILAGAPPGRARWAALRMFAQFAHCLTETMEYYGPRPHPVRLDLPTTDPLQDALRAGRGAVIVTGHFGNWDIAAKRLFEYQRPVNIVAAREANVSTQDYVHAQREDGGVRIIYSDSSVFSSLNMIRALRQNEIVAIQLDRSQGAGGTRPIAFFGAPAPFPTGPFALARLAGAPLIPVFVPRLGRRHYAVRVGDPVGVPREARDPQVLDELMRAVVGQLEGIIREFPTQWFQFQPFWPADQPAATAAVPTQPTAAEARRARG